MPDVSVAIVDSNVLTGMGLRRIIEDLMPMADIRIFTSFEALVAYTESRFVHFFVASRIYFEHAQFFRDNKVRSIVLVNGDMKINGVMTLNVCQPENMLVKSILGMYSMGHGPGHPGPTAGHAGMAAHTAGHKHGGESTETLLSSREIEVAVLLSKGLINKEIADKLNISTTTVITHRTHIMDKLDAHSLADVIIYCVMNGFVDVGEL